MAKFLFSRVEVWLVLVLLLLGLLGAMVFGAIIMDTKQGKQRFGAVGAAAVGYAEIPLTMEEILRADDRMVVERRDRFDDTPGWSFPGSAQGTGLPGYWLFGRMDPVERRGVIEMVRLSDGEVVHTWQPDPTSILADAQRTSKIAHVSNWNNENFRYFAPYLMRDGGLVLKDSSSPLFRVDSCSRKLWVQDATTFHHSTEPDGTGGFWVPSHIEPPGVPHVTETFKDDALTHVSEDGKILQEISVAGILLRHGLQHLMFSPEVTDEDPLHLNDIQPVLTDGPYWKAGDLLLSLRHLAMIMLYRPSTDEIVWMKQGPWMAQHDVDILDDHRITIFNNRAYFRGYYARVDGTSDITVYDFADNSLAHPHHEALRDEKLKAPSEGLYSAIPGGGFVVEAQTSGLILVFGADGQKVGQFVNRIEGGKVYQIGWGRYVDQQTGDEVLQQIEGIDCHA